MANRARVRANKSWNLASLLVVAVALPACGGSDSPGNDASVGPGPGGGEALIAGCPTADNLTETTEWPNCLAGKTIAGKEPFNNSPCELRVGENGKFDYVRNGAVALTLPDRTQWKSATGLYQKTKVGGVATLFLALITPSLDLVSGQPRVISIDLTFNGLAGQQDNIEVEYNDVDLSRKTYNCTMDLF